MIFGTEQALDHQLIGAVAGSGQETAADKARPECVGRGPGPVEIENLELAGGRNRVQCRANPARQFVTQNNQTDDGTEDVHAHLQDICPDDGRHPPFKGVKQCQANDHHNGCEAPGMENDSDHNGDGEDPDTFRKRTSDEENSGRYLPHIGAKPALHQFVGRKKLPGKVLGEKNSGDDDPGQEIAEDHLEEDVAAPEGQRRSSNNGESTGLGGDDRERNRPPGSILASQEVVFQGLLGFFEARAEPGYTKKVGGNYG